MHGPGYSGPLLFQYIGDPTRGPFVGGGNKPARNIDSCKIVAQPNGRQKAWH
mgnify:CR=1 FL=1|jgi:hypothetical protein